MRGLPGKARVSADRLLLRMKAVRARGALRRRRPRAWRGSGVQRSRRGARLGRPARRRRTRRLKRPPHYSDGGVVAVVFKVRCPCELPLACSTACNLAGWPTEWGGVRQYEAPALARVSDRLTWPARVSRSMGIKDLQHDLKSR
eukprot:239242-Prymnesium_polylepis.2